MKIASLFSGIGGFEKGILQADPGVEIVFASEIDKYARQIYKKNYGVEPHGDITKINPANIPDHDILCGGFPCQAFSIAGKRRGFEDTRGTLFFEIMRIAEVKRPVLLFLENVRGLLSHDEGRTFHTIIKSMDDMGYDAEWQVFNSKNHGVPQNRERVFIIGHLRGAGTRPIFPITEGNGAVHKEGDGSTTLIAGCLTGGGHSGGNHSDMTIVQVNNPIHSNNRIYDVDGLSPAINCMEGGNRQPFILCDSGTGHKDQLRTENIAPLRANNGAAYNNIVLLCIRAEHHNTADVHIIPDKQGIRRLTPTECERLQGFPDNWTEGISDTQRYKCLGNAVTVNVIEFIAKHIFKMTDL